MLNGSNAMPDAPGEADGDNTGESDADVHHLRGELGYFHLIVHIDVEESVSCDEVRDHEAGQQGEQQGEAEQDGDGAHELVLLEADAAQQEVQEVAEDTDDGGEDQVRGVQFDWGAAAELAQTSDEPLIGAIGSGDEAISAAIDDVSPTISAASLPATSAVSLFIAVLSPKSNSTFCITLAATLAFSTSDSPSTLNAVPNDVISTFPPVFVTEKSKACDSRTLLVISSSALS